MNSKSHRHDRTSWVICGGHAEWCYVCGAFRQLKFGGENTSAVASQWFKPSGDPKNNPTEPIRIPRRR